MNAARKSAVLVAEAKLELQKMANSEPPTSPLRTRAINLANALSELIGPIERIAGA